MALLPNFPNSRILQGRLGPFYGGWGRGGKPIPPRPPLGPLDVVGRVNGFFTNFTQSFELKKDCAILGLCCFSRGNPVITITHGGEPLTIVQQRRTAGWISLLAYGTGLTVETAPLVISATGGELDGGGMRISAIDQTTGEGIGWLYGLVGRGNDIPAATQTGVIGGLVKGALVTGGADRYHVTSVEGAENVWNGFTTTGDLIGTDTSVTGDWQLGDGWSIVGDAFVHTGPKSVLRLDYPAIPTRNSTRMEADVVSGTLLVRNGTGGGDTYLEGFHYVCTAHSGSTSFVVIEATGDVTIRNVTIVERMENVSWLFCTTPAQEGGVIKFRQPYGPDWAYSFAEVTCQGDAPVAPIYQLHLRATVGTWGEVEPATWVTSADTYPTTRAGLTFGAVGGTGGFDYTWATDARLSGRINFNAATSNYLRIDLPNGPGRYRIWAAVGNPNSVAAMSSSLAIRDGDTLELHSYADVATPGGGRWVVDASGEPIEVAGWLASNGGAHVDIEATQPFITIRRKTAAFSLNSVFIQSLDAGSLQPATMRYEDSLPGMTSVYASEPVGKAYARISSPVGVQNFAVGTAGAAYFEVAQRGGADWLICKAPVPEGYAGGVDIVQSSSGITKVTHFPLTVLSSQGRVPEPGVLGKVSTQTWLARKAVRAVTRVEAWPGYQGEAIPPANDVTVTSGAGLRLAYNAIVPDGVSWYRIQLAEGDYTENLTGMGAPKDFGAGGLLVEPAAGADPAFRCFISAFQARHTEWRNMRIVPRLRTGQNSEYVFSSEWVAGSSTFLSMVVRNCRIGHYFVSDEGQSHWADWGIAFSFGFVEQFAVIDCVFDGLAHAIFNSGGRRYICRNNDFLAITTDLYGISVAFRDNVPRNVFPDNVTYAEFSENTNRGFPDVWAAIPGDPPHSDMGQIRRHSFNTFPYAPYYRGTNPWEVGMRCVSLASNRYYTVAAVTTGIATGTNPPMTTSEAIVDGGVTWAYAGEYTARAPMLLLMENNISAISGTEMSGNGRSTPSNQFFINSNGGMGSSVTITAINNLIGTTNRRGVDNDDEPVNAEYNTFISAPSLPAAGTVNPSYVTGGSVRSRNNIVVTSESSTGVLYSMGNQSARFTAQADNPAQYMDGPFSWLGNAWGYALNDTRAPTRAQFVAAFKAIAKAKGDYGASWEAGNG